MQMVSSGFAATRPADHVSSVLAEVQVSVTGAGTTPAPSFRVPEAGTLALTQRTKVRVLHPDP